MGDGKTLFLPAELWRVSEPGVVRAGNFVAALKEALHDSRVEGLGTRVVKTFRYRREVEPDAVADLCKNPGRLIALNPTRAG